MVGILYAVHQMRKDILFFAIIGAMNLSKLRILKINKMKNGNKLKAIEKIISLRQLRDNKTRENILSDLYEDNIIDSSLFIKLSFTKKEANV